MNQASATEMYAASWDYETCWYLKRSGEAPHAGCGWPASFAVGKIGCPCRRGGHLIQPEDSTSSSSARSIARHRVVVVSMRSFVPGWGAIAATRSMVHRDRAAAVMGSGGR